jgi:hypothetical protein
MQMDLIIFLIYCKKYYYRPNDFTFHKQDNNTPLLYLLQSFTTPVPNMNLKFVSSKEVENILKSLKTKNSSRYDGENKI